MVCPKCGHANPDVAQFCGKCGGPLAAGGASGDRGQAGSPPLTGVSSEMKVIMIIATIVIPLIGMIMGVIYMNSPDPGKKAAGRTWLLVGIGVGVLYCVLSVMFSSAMQSSY